MFDSRTTTKRTTSIDVLNVTIPYWAKFVTNATTKSPIVIVKNTFKPVIESSTTEPLIFVPTLSKNYNNNTTETQIIPKKSSKTKTILSVIVPLILIFVAIGTFLTFKYFIKRRRAEIYSRVVLQMSTLSQNVDNS